MARDNYSINFDDLEKEIKKRLIEKVVPYDEAKILSIREQYIKYLSDGFKGTDISYSGEWYSVNKDSLTDAFQIERRLTQKFLTEKLYEIIKDECLKDVPFNCELEKEIEILNQNVIISKTNYKKSIDMFMNLREEVMKSINKELIEKCQNYIEKTVKTQFKITNNLGLDKIKEVKKDMISITKMIGDSISRLANDKSMHNCENLNSDYIKNKVVILIKEEENMINSLLLKYGYEKMNKSISFFDELFKNKSCNGIVKNASYYLNECEQALVNISKCKNQMNKLQKKLEELNTKVEIQKAVDLWEKA